MSIVDFIAVVSFGLACFSIGYTFVFFVKHFSLKKASEFPVFSEGFSLL